MKRHLQTLAAALLVCGFAIAQYPTRGRFAPPGTSTSDIVAAAGWTYSGTQALATKDAAVPTGNFLFLNGATRSVGFVTDGTDLKVAGLLPLTPASDQAINLGKAAARWSNLYVGEINMGASSARTWIASTPTIAAACTSPTVTNGNTISFQMDVGTSCAGVSTVTLTLSAAASGWSCRGRNITGGITRGIVQTGAVSTTSVTLTSVTLATFAAVDFTDGDDLAIDCTAR